MEHLQTMDIEIESNNYLIDDDGDDNWIMYVLKTIPENNTIFNEFVKAWSIINNPKYEKILCSISGGSDSDILLDIICKSDTRKIVQYVFCDTGLESKFTKNHLTYLV